MNWINYIKDRILIILINGVGVFLLSLYLYVLGDQMLTIVTIDIVYVFSFSVWLFINYRNRKKYFDHMYGLLNQLDKPYLIQEFLQRSWQLEDQLYQDVLYRSNKAVIEKINLLEEEQSEYREFIEGWIHEVKLPITSIRLVSHNEKRESDKRVELYLTEVENAVEQALFYARSDQVYKDYIIEETDVKKMVVRVLSKNKHLLIQNHMSIDLDCQDTTVLTDSKWLVFIIGQILNNAVKYRKGDSGNILFRTEQLGEGTKLIIQDDGIGIPQSEIGRIFDKAFTGSNGRKNKQSTGIGLYLCKNLCTKLGLYIGADSEEGKYTQIYIIFPKSNYITTL